MNCFKLIPSHTNIFNYTSTGNCQNRYLTMFYFRPKSCTCFCTTFVSGATHKLLLVKTVILSSIFISNIDFLSLFFKVSFKVKEN